jgi:hypothetical protein
MKRHPVLGVLTSLMAMAPLTVVVGLVVGRDVPVSNWFVIYRSVLAAGLFVAGAALLFAPPRAAYTVALLAWAFLVADAIWGVIVLWPLEEHWPGSALNLVYLGIGAPVLVFLIVSARQGSRVVNGDNIAV